MNCPHCKAAFESSERLLQHFIDSPACFQRTASLAGADGGADNHPLAPSAINPQACQTSPGMVMTRRSLLLAGAIVVAVSMAMSAAVAVAITVWINSRGAPQTSAETQVAVQPARSPRNHQVASNSNPAALTVPPTQSVQVFTSAPPASVASASTGMVTFSQNAAPAVNVTLKLSASRSRIQLGESFNLTVDVNGADRGVDIPLLSVLPQSAVVFLGQHSNSRSSITIINGRMTRETFEGRVFSYQLTPKFLGAYHTGPVSVTVSGKTYTHPGVTVEVVKVPGRRLYPKSSPHSPDSPHPRSPPAAPPLMKTQSRPGRVGRDLRARRRSGRAVSPKPPRSRTQPRENP